MCKLVHLRNLGSTSSRRRTRSIVCRRSWPCTGTGPSPGHKCRPRLQLQYCTRRLHVKEKDKFNSKQPSKIRSKSNKNESRIFFLTCAFWKVEISLGAFIAKRPCEVIETGTLQRAFGYAHWSSTRCEPERQATNLISGMSNEFRERLFAWQSLTRSHIILNVHSAVGETVAGFAVGVVIVSVGAG